MVSMEVVRSSKKRIAQSNAEKALKESEEQFRTLFESSSDAIMLLDEYSFIDCNSATLKIFGLQNKEDFFGIRPSTLSPQQQPNGEESKIEANRRIKSALENGSEQFEWVHRRQNGEDFHAEVLLTAFQCGDKRLLQASVRDITERKNAEKERENLITELQEALQRIKTLRGLIPICAKCKKIRDDQGFWNQVESYIEEHSSAEFSHGICPDCMKVLYPKYHAKRHGTHLKEDKKEVQIDLEKQT
ncbi:hypothetical protein CEE37_09335 [candidate division LCP-89 bacterium B3_LCP]|uniref:PAS domain-containing protein n=1 Tax=candidate division LCP-89 bacterium B3_LCP TaxID=2012998 RepID=A0A532UYA2_UNCL8|nr:MAG: hypothetical protein CEE37_09335 [candidate division LCP-89 bacterium B3_LCP]